MKSEIKLDIGDKIKQYWDTPYGPTISEYIVLRGETGLFLHEIYHPNQMGGLTITSVRKILKGTHPRYVKEDIEIIKASYNTSTPDL